MKYVTQLSLDPGIDMGYSTWLVVDVDTAQPTAPWDNFDLLAIADAHDADDQVTVAALMNALRAIPCVLSADFAEFAYLER